MQSRIFRQTIPIEKVEAAPLPTEFVKYDGETDKQIYRQVASNEFLKAMPTMLVVQMHRQIFRQTIPIEKVEAAPLPTKIVKYDGIEASICAAKALAVHFAVLP